MMSRIPRPKIDMEAVLAGFALTALVAAGVVLAVPDRLGALSELAATARPVVSLAALVGGALGLVFLLRMPSLDGDGDTLDIDDGNAAVARGDPLGHDIDEALDRYSDANEWERIKARKLVRQRLTAATVHVLTEQEGVSEAAARRQVVRGTWTDDRVAAAFLASDGEIVLPLRTRLREWLQGEQFARHARRVVSMLAERSADLRVEDPSLARQSKRGGERTAAVRIRADGGER